MKQDHIQGLLSEDTAFIAKDVGSSDSVVCRENFLKVVLGKWQFFNCRHDQVTIDSISFLRESVFSCDERFKFSEDIIQSVSFQLEDKLFPHFLHG